MEAKMRVCAPAPWIVADTMLACSKYTIVAPNDSRLTQAATPSRYGERINSGNAAKALALLAGEEVGHERPEHRDGKEAEHGDPDEENARHDHRRNAGGQQQP